MPADKLRIYEKPTFTKPRMLMGFSGWMDGGEVSTGTIRYLSDTLGAKKFAEIEPEGFYIYNFPGSMELTGMFRPHTTIENGLIKSYKPPENLFLCSEENELILFTGKEPNLQWQEFTDCIFSICSEFGVKTIYFIGSVAGLVPHTREPRIFCSVSDAAIKETFEHHGLKFSDYQGPASIVTELTVTAAERRLSMASLVATVPAYVQGNNPKCIAAVTRRLASFLDLKINLDDLQETGEEFEKRLTDVIQEQPELANTVAKLEENYDKEIFDNEMGELKSWLEQKGVRLD